MLTSPASSAFAGRAVLLLSLAAGTCALADPCTAIPDKGPLPAYLAKGAAFSGPVTYVGDGDSLCIGLGVSPDRWVEVRLADFYAPELNAAYGQSAKQALEKVVRGQRLNCVADHRSYDRVVAVCRVGAKSVGDLLRAAGAAEGGNGRPAKAPPAAQ